MRDYFDEHDNFNPECPEHRPFCPEDRPDMPPFCPDDHRDHRRVRPPHMPPVPSVVSGMDLYEAMNNLTGRVNTCIESYNAVMAENYKTLHNLQRAAEENGAYYDPSSVFVEEGYYADESATFHLIHKRCVDRRGEPIRMQLHLAYGNTTNSMIGQSMFAASKVEYADKIVVAIPKTDKGWYGKAIYHGCPIASADESELYTVGFTKSGVMRVYNNGANIDQMLRDTVVDAMGCSGVLIQNGQITDDAYRKNIPSATEQVSRVVMGQVGSTKEVVILTVGNEDDVHRKGMTSLACANVLKEYGCDIAVELCEGEGSGAMDKGSLMYVPDGNEEPKAYAYWFISRKCFYRNDYERELAELVQNYGACMWQGFLNKKSIEQVKSELDAEIERAKAEEARLDGKIDAETDRATEAERVLQENIDKETERATEAERVLQENIDKETERAEAEEGKLDDKIDAEIERASTEEDRLDKKIDAEIERASTEENRLDKKIDAEIERASTEEDRLEQKIDAETVRATEAEKKLTEDLDSEVHRATNAEAILHQEILTEQGERVAADKVLQTNINTEASTRADADKVLQSNIDKEVSRATASETVIQTNVDNEVNRAKSEESRIEGLVTDEVTRAKNAESVLQSDIDKEAERAKAAEGVLQQNIDAETKRATGAEEKLASDLDTEVHARETSDTNLHTEITTVDGKLTALTSRVDECESDIANLQTVTTALQQQMSALDKTVAGMLQTVSDVESAMNDVKLAVSNMQTLVNALSLQFEELKKTVETFDGRISALEGDVANIESDIAGIVDGTTELPYVKKSGDTMSGALNIKGTSLSTEGQTFNITTANNTFTFGKSIHAGSQPIYDVAGGTEETHAVNVSQLQSEVNRAKNAEQGNSAAISVLSSALSSVSNTLESEIERATEEDEKLRSDLNYEVERAKEAESDMDTKFVHITGDGMQGNLGLGGYKIQALANGSADTDAVNVSQLNTETTRAKSAESTLQSAITAEANRAESAESSIKSSYVKKSGDTMSGALAMGSHKITGLTNGSDNQDAATVAQVNAVKATTNTELAVTLVSNLKEGKIFLARSGNVAILQVRWIMTDASKDAEMSVTLPSTVPYGAQGGVTCHGYGGTGINFYRLTYWATETKLVLHWWKESGSASGTASNISYQNIPIILF